MDITRTAIAIVAASCVTAGAAGGYLLTRNASSPVDALQSGPLVSPDPAPVAVEQSEAVVTEAVPVPAQAPVRHSPVSSPPAPRPAPIKARNDVVAEVPPAARPVEIAAVAPAPIQPVSDVEIEAPQPAAVEAPKVDLEELVVAVDSVIGIQLESLVSTETAQLEDDVRARVTRDVKVGDRVAIPAGAKAHGEVTVVERGGKVRERARLGVRFTSIVLADGTRLPIDTEAVFREGTPPGRESAAKIGGGAIGGAIIGGILGGAKGAAIGGAIGGGAGSATVLAGGRNPAQLSPGEQVTIRLQQPVAVTVER